MPPTNSSWAAVHGVGPGAGGVDREGAVAVGAGHAGLRHEGRRAVDVGGVEVAARVLCTALVSVRLAVYVPVITAASLVPRMLTVMTCVVPSAVATVKLSV